MIQGEFRNALCILRSIDFHEVSGFMSDEQWRSFRAAPGDFFVRADDSMADKLWRIIQRRQKAEIVTE